MFSDNQRISRRQLERQLLLGLTGVFLMTLPGLPILQGWSGVLGFFLGTFFLWVFLFFLVRTTAVAKGLEERIGKIFYRIVTLFYLSYLIFTGAYLIRMTVSMVCRTLLSEYPDWFVGIVLVSAILIGTGNDLQRRGRLGEASCVLVVGGLCCLIVLAILQMKPRDLWRFSPVELSAVFESAYHVFCSFSIVGILPFLMHYVERPQSSLKYLCRATGIASVVGLAGVVAVQILFGAQGVRQKAQPITALLATVNFPGGFFDRFDAIWMVFLLFSLLYSGGTVFYYSQHLLKSKNSIWIRIVLAAMVLGISFLGEEVLEVYSWCVRTIYVPVFVVFGLGLSKIRRKM